MKNMLREKILRGEKTIGSFFELGSASVLECLGLAGLDFAIIDTEHGAFDPLAALEYIRVAKQYGMTPLARVQEISRPAILKLLDAGAMGLIIPNVGSVDEVRQIVGWGKYMPLGHRGVAPSAGTDFWMSDYASQGLEHYFEVSNRETMLLPQCETVGCLENIEEIAALPGVDGIFVGPFDLSASMGIPGQFEKPEFKEALERILAACKTENKPTMIYAANERKAKDGFAMGFDSVAYSMDALVLAEAYKALLASLR